MLDIISNGYGAKETWKTSTNSDILTSYRRKNHVVRGVAPAFKTGCRYGSRKTEHASVNNSLAFYKRSPLVLPENKIRPYDGRCCSVCCPLSQHSLIDDIYYSFGINNLFDVPAKNKSILFRWCCNLHYSTFVKHPWKYKPLMHCDILMSPLVKDAIEKTVYHELEKFPPGKLDFKKVENKAIKGALHHYQSFKTVISVPLIRVAGWVLLNVFGKLFKSILVHKGQLCTLEQGMKTSNPIIYIPTHRSHADYLLLTLVLFSHGLRMPYVAAGSNLNIPVVGWLLKKFGAVYIRRKLDSKRSEKDLIYRRSLQLYFENTLLEGNDVEFFIEGGRTRTGKMSVPKGGLLSVVVDAVEKDMIPDALIVPVSINYDRNLDGEFVQEQLGEPKKPESFFGFLKSAWSVLRSSFGSVRIEFGQPFSLKEFLKQSTSYSLPNEDVLAVCGERKESTMSFQNDSEREMITKLSYHISYNLAVNFPIMSTNIVAAVILSQFRAGGQLDELVQWCEFCRSELFHRHKDVAFTGDTNDVVLYAMDLLGKDNVNVFSKESSAPAVFTVSQTPRNQITLNFYANTLYMFFNLESIVATSVLKLLSPSYEAYIDSDVDLRVDEDSLMLAVQDLCEIFCFEFNFAPPCTSLDHYIHNVIQRFSELGIFKKVGVGLNYQRRSSFGDFNDDELWDEERIEYQIICAQRNIDILKFYAGFTRPLVYTYYIAATHLNRLVQTEMVEAEFVLQIQSDIKLKIETKSLDYGECCSLEPVKNAIRYFLKSEVLGQYEKENARTLYLNSSHDTGTAVTHIMERINKFVI